MKNPFKSISYPYSHTITLSHFHTMSIFLKFLSSIFDVRKLVTPHYNELTITNTTSIVDKETYCPVASVEDKEYFYSIAVDRLAACTTLELDSFRAIMTMLYENSLGNGDYYRLKQYKDIYFVTKFGCVPRFKIVNQYLEDDSLGCTISLDDVVPTQVPDDFPPVVMESGVEETNEERPVEKK